MTELKITIDQLKNYLGTGLKLLPNGNSAAEDNVLIGIYQDPCLSCDCVYFGTIEGQDMRTIQEMKPICYRLSDLDKRIPELGFVPLDELGKIDPIDRSGEIKTLDDFGIKYQQTSVSDYFELIQKLFQWHFWPFGDEYFEAGLVIDKLKQTTNEN